MKSIHFLKRFSQGYGWLIVALIMVTLGYAALNLVNPLIFSYLIDNIIDLKPITSPFFRVITELFGGVQFIRQHLWIGALMILGTSTVLCLCVFIRGRLNAVISEGMAATIRDTLYQHLQYLPYFYHGQVKTGDLIQRCTSDVDTIRRFLAGQFSEMIFCVATALFAIFVLFGLYPPLAWISVSSMPILFLYAMFFFRNVQRSFLASDTSEGVMTMNVQESLNGIRVIKAFHRENYEVEKFEKKNREFRDLTYKVIRHLGQYWSSSDFICLTQILVVVLFGIVFALQEQISVGTFFVFISYEGMILWPVRNLGRLLSDMGKMDVSIGRLQEILDEPTEDVETGEKPQIKGEIRFDHVSFHYEDSEQLILNDVSFTIEQGKTVALLGPTGSGKSTLVHLLSRLYDATDGHIYFDGQDITTMSRRHVREHVGIVLQEPFLFSKTIYDNIQLANKHAGKNRIEEAAKIASVHDVINEFDQGYNTLVGEKGVTLSGGQKQRIAIARTLVQPTPILVFDDSLSAVDTQTDAAIRSALKQVQQQTTTFIITQRVASAQQADLILVLEKGKITQQGTHEQLLAEEGLYQRIHAIQTALQLGGEENESTL